MPDGSSGPGPLLSSFTSNTTTTTTTTAADHSSSPSPPRQFLLSGPPRQRPTTSVDHGNMKAKLFGGPPSSPTTARPRTGHQTIRGRISGPIPMPNPVDDDEFPIRNPGTGIASSTPIESDLAMQRQLQQSASTPASPMMPGFAPAVAQTFPIAAGRVDIVDVPQTVLEHPSTPTQHPPSSSTGPSSRPSPEGGASSASAAHSSTAKAHRANPSGSARYSTLSANTEKTGTSNLNSPMDATHNGAPPQRKKSTLRSAIGKLLRRRKKEGSLSSVSEVDRQVAMGGQQQQQHHRSVPPAARNVPSEHLAPRVLSMPISEFDRALRSHSIGPDDITAIESARNSMDVLGSSPNRKRAATVINTNITAAGIIPRSRGEDWAGLSPRPASTHARGSRFTEEDPDAIGRAITSDSGGGDLGHKRRSRSLSQLNEVALEQGGGRRRSDEIRYWRESYDVPGPLSPMSSVPNDNDTEAHEENYELGRVSMSVAGSAADRIPKTPPQPFHFGSVASMNEMAGMKITQAVTLEERFGNLEVRMIKLERVVDQLCHSVPGFTGPFTTDAPAPRAAPPTNSRQRSGSTTTGAGVPTQHVSVAQPTYAYSNAVPPMIPAIYQTSSPGPSRDGFVPSSRFTNASRRSLETSTDDNTSSRMSFGDGHTYMDSLHPPSSSATQAVSTVATSVPPVPAMLRPTSESTVRPAASMPSLGSQQGSVSGDGPSSNSASLVAQLDQERAQRQQLEEQVRKLSERMNNLSTTMFAMVRDPAKSQSRSNERMRPQTAHSASSVSTPPATSTSHHHHHHLAPISVNTSRTSPSAIAPSSKAQSIFGKESVAPTGALSSLASSPSKEVGDDEFSDAFQTPREEPTPGGLTYSQAFGDDFGAAAGYAAEQRGETEEDMEERKRAARTLSLSQLTMGKGVPTKMI